MLKLSNLIMVALALSIVGCASVKDSAKALGTAGQTATQTLVSQTDAAKQTLTYLPESWGISGTLNCSTTKPGSDVREACIKGSKDRIKEYNQKSPLSDHVKTLVNIMNKRIITEQALRDAYQAFTNLAVYDAGAETEQAIKGLFGSVQALGTAISAFDPIHGAALTAMTGTFTTVASGLGNIIASEYQEKLILDANRDIHKATDALYLALSIERDKRAAESLLTELADENDKLYGAYVRIGLVSPIDSLVPALTTISPGTQIQKNPPATNNDVIQAASEIARSEQFSRNQDSIIASYEASLAELKALSAEHEKLQSKQSITLDSILNLEMRITTLINSTSK